jgi:serine/threonine protein kinase
MLTTVWEYCVSEGITFKIIGSPLAVKARSLKYAPREASGKAATIYPADDTACERILRELDAEIGGTAGPYILSDLRYGAGPLYVRYGGFIERSCLDADGERVLAIEDPAGELVPDVRSPVFTVPEWVQMPEFLSPHLAARNAVGMADLPYDVTGALHFSNGGGVYTATDKRDGAKVILKEARPHAGLAADGSDAVTRLQRERDSMRRLSGLGIAPEVRDYFQVGDHHFLTEDFIEGRTLSAAMVARYPLARPTPSETELADFSEWAVRMCTAVEQSVEQMHERGLIFNDLHTFNIMVRPDETVAFIDFEAASAADEARHFTVGNPGFAAPASRTGFGIDAYSLACVRLSLFMPLTDLFRLHRAKAEQIAAEIGALFPLPAGFLEQAVAEITRDAPRDQRAAPVFDVPRAFPEPGGSPVLAGLPEPAVSRRRGVPLVPRPRPGTDDNQVHPDNDGVRAHHDRSSWKRLSARLVTSIRASATPDRRDRLFPGDIDQFRLIGGGLGLAYGAAGVLYALDEAAGVRVPEYEQWLISQVKSPPAGMSLGCWHGLTGVAWTLGRLGHRAVAIRLADRCLDRGWEGLGHSLFDGVAGIGLAMLELARTAGEPALTAAGLRAAEIVADDFRPRAASVAMTASHSGGDRTGTGTAGRAAGLMHGACGRALLLIRAYERTADPGYLDAAAAAIAADLQLCADDRHDGLQVDEGWRLMPYLRSGSAGIGMVIDQFLRHRPDPDLAVAADRIAVSATSTYFAHSGLFNGRSGLLYFLASRDSAETGTTAPDSTVPDSQFRPAARTSPRVRDHAARIAWHAMPYADGLAFPGDMLFRLSMDLGTGTAGVLLGLAAALAPDGAAMPFLTSLPERSRVPRGPGQGAVQDRELVRR